jgi:hypothetical protein
MKKFMAILLGLILSTSLFAGTRDPSVPDEKYLEYGSKFKCVLSICGIYDDGGLFCASCVVIEPRWVITAAHVVKGAKHCGIATENSDVILIEKIFCHEDYNGTFGKADIALCYLKEPINLDFYPELYSDKEEVGKACSISGYGLTGTFVTGQNFSDGKKRAGSNIVEKIENDLLVCTPTKKGQGRATTLEYLICSGDSGGGLFIDQKLAGINSCVFTVGKVPLSKYGEESGHTRISKFAPWILETKKWRSDERKID